MEGWWVDHSSSYGETVQENSEREGYKDWIKLI